MFPSFSNFFFSSFPSFIFICSIFFTLLGDMKRTRVSTSHLNVDFLSSNGWRHSVEQEKCVLYLAVVDYVFPLHGWWTPSRQKSPVPLANDLKSREKITTKKKKSFFFFCFCLELFVSLSFQLQREEKKMVYARCWSEYTAYTQSLTI